MSVSFRCRVVPLTLGLAVACWGAREIHVAQRHPDAADATPGSTARPLLTIQRGTELARAGDSVVIHGGTYREHVHPVRSGRDSDLPIVHREVEDLNVAVFCAEPWAVTFQRAALGDSGVPVWRGRIPASRFSCDWPVEHFNLCVTLRQTRVGDKRGRRVAAQHERCRTQEKADPRTQTTGMVTYPGVALRQAANPAVLEQAHGLFLVDRDGESILFRVPGDVPSRSGGLELAVCQQAFAYVAKDSPHAAFGTVSSSSGCSWTFEDCAFRYANSRGATFASGNSRRPLPNYNRISGDLIQAIGYNAPNAMGYNPHTVFCRPGNPEDHWADVSETRIPATAHVTFDYFGTGRDQSDGLATVGPIVSRERNPEHQFFVPPSTCRPNPGALEMPPAEIALHAKMPCDNLNLPAAPWNRSGRRPGSARE